MGITVSHSAMLAHCQALTQACGYTEGGEDSACYELLVLYHLFITGTVIFKEERQVYLQPAYVILIKLKVNIVKNKLLLEGNWL